MDIALPRTALLVRMPRCPWGLRARYLLRSHGFAFEERLLTSAEEVAAFKAEAGVKTTPQLFIAGQRVGGHDDLRRWLGLPVHDAKAMTYRPVAALFGMAAAIAMALGVAVQGTPFSAQVLAWAVGLATCLLAFLKLKDVEGFVSGFLGYDFLAQTWLPYAYVYAWAEAAAGLLMLSGRLPGLAAGIALVIGSVGAVSVVKVVYVEKRQLSCACVGGGSNVPLGAVSLLENLMMIAMGVWMLAGRGI